VSAAGHVERALATWRAHLVVLEHRLPDASGLDVLAALKSRWPRLPVVMVTGYGSEAVCAAALKLGIRDYFIKPWTRAEIVTSFREILSVGPPDDAPHQNGLAPPREDAGRRIRTRDTETAAIRRAAQRIQENLEDPVSFDALARELRLSKPALSQRFTRTIGVSYRQLMSRSRIARARELLSSSDYTVTQIAQMVGFGDLPRFDKVFKAVVGASPSAYRQQQTSRNNLLAEEAAG
jgi:YesN/AraC family two-component response regulator